MEKDKSYYFEVLGNNVRGPWEIGLAAKLHDSSLHGGEYIVDTEQQRIDVTSQRIEEEHVSQMMMLVRMFLMSITFHIKFLREASYNFSALI